MASELVPIFIMGKKYEVPSTLTIMKAMEYAGYRFIRGCGCRGGYCGACATVYRKPGDYKLKVGLACQTVVEPNMYLGMLPFYPANKALYELDKVKAASETIISLYPEVLRCVGCNSCTRVCPQDLKVMEYVSAAAKGDLAKAAEQSFECLMCGLCATRCPAGIVHYYVGMLARRLYARYLLPEDPFLPQRIEEIDSGKYEGQIKEYMKMDKESLEKVYRDRPFDLE